jgi:RNA polymerase sigma-70 factor, ECF subfamily
LQAADDFEAFYRGAYPRLVGQLFLVAGNMHEAEDCVQEAFVRAALRWRALRQYDQPELWVRRVAMNLANDGFRRARRRLLALARFGDQRRTEAQPAAVDQLELAAALGRLNSGQRQVVVMHHLLDLPVDEVARQLGLPAGTVKSRLARAREILSRTLGSEQEGADVARHA